MSYYLSVIKNSPSGFWKTDETSGSIAYDSSGCGNHGSYFGEIIKGGLPLVNGGSHSIKITNSNYIEFQITKDFSGLSGTGGFGTNTTSDNDFTLEVWVHPKNITSLTPILADSNGVGLYWDNGNILFKLESEEVFYSVPNPNRSLHIVGIYSVNAAYLYLNGSLVASKSLSKINFTNEYLTFSIGPANINEYFIIDAPAIYRYSLTNNDIINHYNNFFTNTESNIVLPDSGELFKPSEKYQSISNTFAFPAQLDWQYHINENLSYREQQNSIYLNKNSSYGEFIKVISLPVWKNYISSKIEWLSSNGVSFWISNSGEENSWYECTNNSSLPNFSQELNSANKKVIYIKVKFESSNSAIYIPELYYFKIHFYDEKKIWSHNGGSIISTSQPNSGDYWDIDISNNNSSILLRNFDNGIKTKNSVFYIDTIKNIKNIEMIFSPESLGSGYLIYNKTGSVESYVSWSNTGLISKSNIASIYINGVDVSLENNISNYIYIGDINYISIKFTSTITDKIWLNGKQDNGNRSNVLPNNIYQNISIYEIESYDELKHYNLYIGKDVITAYDSVIQISEESIKTYSRDKILVNNA